MKISHIGKQEIQKGEDVKGEDIRESIFNLIKIESSDFNKYDFITLSELNQYRRLNLTSLITQEKGELAVIDRDVMGKPLKTTPCSLKNSMMELKVNALSGNELPTK